MEKTEKKLSGIKVAILVTNGFEQVELTGPRKALEQSGAETFIISPEKEKVKSWDHREWGEEFDVDISLDNAIPSDYDALLLPGGTLNPDKLRMNEKALEFVRHFFYEDKPVGAICHGPWTLINVGVVKGRKMTSYPSVKIDLINAGADWEDSEVVVDKNLVTSRSPKDLSVFNKKIIEVFSRIRHVAGEK